MPKVDPGLWMITGTRLQFEPVLERVRVLSIRPVPLHQEEVHQCWMLETPVADGATARNRPERCDRSTRRAVGHRNNEPEQKVAAFAYGDLELSVCHCRKVSLICVQTRGDVVELPPSVAGGTGAFPAGLKHADVASTLDRAG